MPLSTAGKNAACSGGLAASALYMSLHSADPGGTGASEISGGSPAYARKAISWGAPSGGAISNTAAVTHDVGPGTTISHAGFWTAASGGTFIGSAALSASESFTGQGTYTVAIGDIDLVVP